MATFILGSIIKIGAFKPFPGVNEIVIKKSLRNYCDTATIKLPATSVLRQSATQTQSVDTAKQFKRGDKVSVQLAYNGKYNGEFEGFISRVNKATPCVLECEGYAFQLREKTINKIYRKASLKTILADLIEGTDIVLAPDNYEVAIDKMDFIKFPRFKALETLIKDLAGSVNIWFEGNVLFAGLKYLYFNEKNQAWVPDVHYKIGFNIVRDGDMKERLSGDSNYEVELYNRSANGKVTTAKVGVTNSNIQRKKIQAVSSMEDRKKMADAIEKDKNYTGFEGSITAFLLPLCKPGYKMKLTDPKYPERSGNYLIESVETRYSPSGARRKIELSFKL